MSEKIFESVWPGLSSYTEKEASLFFGRDTEIEKLYTLSVNSPLCTLYGPSGTGKSSLLQAGVFPRFRENGYLPVLIRLDHSVAAPAYSKQITKAFLDSALQFHVDVKELASSHGLDEEETIWEWFHRHRFVDKFMNPVLPIIVIDQFEEIFTLADDNQRVDAWFGELSDFCSNEVPDSVLRTIEKNGKELEFSVDEQPWRVIISLREDFLSRLEEKTEEHVVFRNNRISISAFDRDQALQAVLGPGDKIVNEDVAFAIVELVGRSTIGKLGKVDPSLLSLFCSQLDQRRCNQGLAKITKGLLMESGQSILYAFYAKASSMVSAKTMRLFEEHLLTVNGFRASWAVADAENAGITNEEWSRLVAARLLHVEHRGGVQWLEYSHDVLVSIAQKFNDDRRMSDEALQFHKELKIQRRKRRRITILFCSLLVLIGMSSFFSWFYFYRDYVTYYRDFTFQWGSPIGIGTELSLNEVKSRSCSYRLIRKGKYSFGSGQLRKKTWWPIFLTPVARVEAVNDALLLTTTHGKGTHLWRGEYVKGEKLKDGLNFSSVGVSESVAAKIQGSDELSEICAWDFSYSDSGFLLKQSACNKNGRVIWIANYFILGCRENGHALYASEKKVLVHYSDENGFPVRHGNSSAEYAEVTYDRYGFDGQIVFKNLRGNIVKGPFDVKGVKRIYNENGECELEYYIDEINSMMLSKDGYAVVRKRYDDSGNVIKESYCDVYGIPTLLKEGYAECRKKYNNRGMVVEKMYYGLDGEPILNKNGIAGEKTEYDMCGRVISVMYLGVDGKLSLCKDGFSICRREINDTKRVVKITYLGTSGEPIFCMYGNAGGMGEYDRHGRGTRVVLLDIDGKPILGKDGYAEYRKEYDTRGNVTKMSYYGIDGKPILGKDGYAEYRAEYDAYGNATKQLYYGVDGKPILLKDGYVGWECEYDNRGREIRVVFIGDDDKPTLRKDGHAEYRKEYDTRGNVTKMSYYGIDGKPILHKNGYAGWCQEYDERGKVTKELYYGVDGKPILLKNGYAELRCEYDARGNMTKELYYGVDGKPILHKNGYAELRWEYDERGKVTKQLYYGVDGKPILINNEYSSVQLIYDNKGEVIEIEYFDLNGIKVKVVK